MKKTCSNLTLLFSSHPPPSPPSPPDNDGTIDFDEFCLMVQASGNKDADRIVKTAFEQFDQNKDGTIELDDLTIVAEELKEAITRNELTQVKVAMG